MPSSCSISCLSEIATGVQSHLEITPAKFVFRLIGQFVLSFIVLWITNAMITRYSVLDGVSNEFLMYLSIGLAVATMIVYVMTVYSARYIVNTMMLK